ncbi:MAG TPA: DUF1049 domain-containing protein [Actinobacteria bacterium]|nr:DUF1049 domain-containing protein [Actinomycetota bacterium]
MEKKKTRKLLWLVILLILIVGIISGISVCWWQRLFFEKEKDRLGTELEEANRKIKKLESKMPQIELEEEAPEITVTSTIPPGMVTPKPKISRECGVLKQVYTSGGKNYLKIDYVQFLVGEEADEAAREDGEIGPGEHAPNDYYIRNVSPKIRTLEVDKGAEIVVETYPITAEGFVLNKQELNFTTFKQAFENDQITALCWITLENNVVIKIEEQFVP